MNDFEWFEPGELADDDLTLVLSEKSPADPSKGYVPAYKFEMRHTVSRETIGTIDLRVGDTEPLRMYGGHVGYGVFSEFRGRRYVARACRLLLPLQNRTMRAFTTRRAPCWSKKEHKMHDLNQHPYFEKWSDPSSGVESFILNERVAPVQQSFYFTNVSISPDENWLWFYAAFPPNLQKVLGVVSLDPRHPEIKLFPQAGFSSASPMVGAESDAAYFCMGSSVYKVSVDGSTQVVCTVPEEYIGKRQFSRIATHLTVSADGKYLLLDGDLGNFWWVGIGDIATGEVKVLKEFGNHHNHAMFSPTDPKLFVIPEDWWNDKNSGRHFSYDHRMWLMDIEQTRYEVVRPKSWDSGHTASASHEWWSRDGMLCWNDYELGTYECDPYTLEATHVWKRPLCHAHCSSDRNLWCADESPYKWDKKPVEILFFDRNRNTDLQIVSAMPKPPLPRGMYHIDPHPQFSPRDSWVVYTTTVRGKVDVALAPVRPLLA